MKSASGVTAAKTAIRSLRWAVVLALVFCLLGNLVYAAVDTPAPALLTAVQNRVFMPLFYALRETGVVIIAGAIIAPGARRTTAIVLAVLLVAHSFWGHVLATGGPWWSWTINYTHFSLAVLGAVLGVGYIFWSERASGSVASGPPDAPEAQ